MAKRTMVTGIGVFVLHYADDAMTHACIDSWMDEADELAAQVYVIDNGSPTPFKRDGVTVIRLESNQFLIDAFNAGMEQHPHGIYICVTNDTRKVNGVPFLQGLVAVLEDQRIGIAAPGTNDSGGGTLHCHPLSKPDHATRHVDNVVWAWRRDLVEAVGFPSADGHTHRACWYSNKDFCQRARAAGYLVVAATGSSFIQHLNTGGRDFDAHSAGVAWLRERGNYADAW